MTAAIKLTELTAGSIVPAGTKVRYTLHGKNYYGVTVSHPDRDGTITHTVKWADGGDAFSRPTWCGEFGDVHSVGKWFLVQPLRRCASFVPAEAEQEAIDAATLAAVTREPRDIQSAAQARAWARSL